MKVKWERFSNINIISRQNNQSNHSSRSRCLNNGSSKLIFSSSTMLISSIIIIIIIIIRSSSRSKYFHNSRIYRQITMEFPPLIYIFIRNRIWNWNSSREGYNWRTTTTSSRSLVEIIIIITTTTTTPVDLLSPGTAAALFRFRRLPRISMEISVAEMIMTSLLFNSLHWPGHHTFGTPSQNKNENNHTLL